MRRSEKSRWMAGALCLLVIFGITACSGGGGGGKSSEEGGKIGGASANNASIQLADNAYPLEDYSGTTEKSKLDVLSEEALGTLLELGPDALDKNLQVGDILLRNNGAWRILELDPSGVLGLKAKVSAAPLADAFKEFSLSFKLKDLYASQTGSTFKPDIFADSARPERGSVSSALQTPDSLSSATVNSHFTSDISPSPESLAQSSSFNPQTGLSFGGNINLNDLVSAPIGDINDFVAAAPLGMKRSFSVNDLVLSSGGGNNLKIKTGTFQLNPDISGQVDLVNKSSNLSYNSRLNADLVFTIESSGPTSFDLDHNIFDPVMNFNAGGVPLSYSALLALQGKVLVNDATSAEVRVRFSFKTTGSVNYAAGWNPLLLLDPDFEISEIQWLSGSGESIEFTPFIDVRDRFSIIGTEASRLEHLIASMSRDDRSVVNSVYGSDSARRADVQSFFAVRSKLFELETSSTSAELLNKRVFDENEKSYLIYGKALGANEGAALELTNSSGKTSQAYTDDQGNFGFGQLMPDIYTLTGIDSKHTFEPASMSIDIVDQNREVLLKATPKVNGPASDVDDNTHVSSQSSKVKTPSDSLQNQNEDLTLLRADVYPKLAQGEVEIVLSWEDSGSREASPVYRVEIELERKNHQVEQKELRNITGFDRYVRYEFRVPANVFVRGKFRVAREAVGLSDPSAWSAWSGRFDIPQVKLERVAPEITNPAESSFGGDNVYEADEDEEQVTIEYTVKGEVPKRGEGGFSVRMYAKRGNSASYEFFSHLMLSGLDFPFQERAFTFQPPSDDKTYDGDESLIYNVSYKIIITMDLPVRDERTNEIEDYEVFESFPIFINYPKNDDVTPGNTQLEAPQGLKTDRDQYSIDVHGDEKTAIRLSWDEIQGAAYRVNIYGKSADLSDPFKGPIDFSSPVVTLGSGQNIVDNWVVLNDAGEVGTGDYAFTVTAFRNGEEATTPHHDASYFTIYTKQKGDSFEEGEGLVGEDESDMKGWVKITAPVSGDRMRSQLPILFRWEVDDDKFLPHEVEAIKDEISYYKCVIKRRDGNWGDLGTVAEEIVTGTQYSLKNVGESLTEEEKTKGVLYSFQLFVYDKEGKTVKEIDAPMVSFKYKPDAGENYRAGALGRPIDLWPNNNDVQKTRDVKLTWSEVSGATHYAIRFFSNWDYQGYGSEEIITDLSQNQYQLRDLETGKYVWQVRAGKKVGGNSYEWGEWSRTAEFEANPHFMRYEDPWNLQVDDSSFPTVKLSWENDPEVKEFSVVVLRKAGSSNGEVIVQKYVAGTQYELKLDSGKYEFSVYNVIQDLDGERKRFGFGVYEDLRLPLASNDQNKQAPAAPEVTWPPKELEGRILQHVEVSDSGIESVDSITVWKTLPKLRYQGRLYKGVGGALVEDSVKLDEYKVVEEFEYKDRTLNGDKTTQQFEGLGAGSYVIELWAINQDGQIGESTFRSFKIGYGEKVVPQGKLIIHNKEQNLVRSGSYTLSWSELKVASQELVDAGYSIRYEVTRSIPRSESIEIVTNEPNAVLYLPSLAELGLKRAYTADIGVQGFLVDEKGKLVYEGEIFGKDSIDLFVVDPLPTPEILEPQDESTDMVAGQHKFSWTEIEGSGGSQVKIIEIQNSEAGAKEIVLEDTVLLSAREIPFEAKAGHQYRLGVRAIEKLGSGEIDEVYSSDWVWVQVFQVLPEKELEEILTEQITGLSPDVEAGSVTIPEVKLDENQGIELKWNAIEGADGYRYTIKNAKTSDIYRRNEMPVEKTSARVQIPVGEWTWWVVALTHQTQTNQEGESQDLWVEHVQTTSDEANFDTVDQNGVGETLTKPTGLSPSNMAKLKKGWIELTWNAVAGAEFYTVIVEKWSNGSYVSHGAPYRASTNSYLIHLDEAGQWGWAVQAHAQGKADSLFASADFDTGDGAEENKSLEKPQVISPTGHSKVFGSSTSLRWFSVQGAHGYEVELEVFESNPLGGGHWNSDWSGSGETFISSHSVSITKGQRYRWKVRALGDSFGDEGPWTDWQYFDTLTN